MITILKRTTAIAALAALPLAPIAAHAQSQGEQNQSQQSAQSSGEGSSQKAGQNAGDAGASTAANTAQNALKGKPDQAASSDEQASDTQVGQPAVQSRTSGAAQGKDAEAQEQTQAKVGAGQEVDVLVAKVGDSEIRRSDVLGVIGMLPPQLQQQPPEMLIPLALDQLVLRELILQEAQKEGLGNDPEVTGMVSDASDQAREDAMVQVWLDRQLADAVTESKVSETYGAIQGELGAQAPELEQIRPQIEQELRRQAFNEISTDLQADADVTVYGPNGQPVTQ